MFMMSTNGTIGGTILLEKNTGLDGGEGVYVETSSAMYHPT